MKNELGVESPVVFPDKGELGDKRLSPEESVAKLKEDTRKIEDTFRIPNQDIFENKQMSLGNAMSHGELIRRLQKLSSSILIEEGGWPNSVAVRIPDPREESGKRYVTGFVKEPLPEWSHVILDKRGLPHREVRGWRPVVEALVGAGAITKQQYYAAFGEPLGARSILWQGKMQGR